MDDVEIVVRRRKGVDERKALKLLSKFLKRDQEKDADDRLPADVALQLQQVQASLKGKAGGAGPLALAAVSSPPREAAAAARQDDEGASSDIGAAATGSAARKREEGQDSEVPSEKKRKKKKHKKE